MHAGVWWNLAAKSDSSTITADELWDLYVKVSVSVCHCGASTLNVIVKNTDDGIRVINGLNEMLKQNYWIHV